MLAWKTIRRLASEKSRGLRQRQPRIVDKDNREPAEPQLEDSSGLPLRGQVKWFNANKGYGFVQLSDGTGDIFLHATALERIGLSALQPGETLEMRVALGQRGLQVAEVISVDSTTAAPARHPRASFGSPSDQQPLEASAQEMGTVKWYNAMKGFGFIVRDSGGRDVFVHASALQRAGITGLNEGQRVYVGVATGQKGQKPRRSNWPSGPGLVADLASDRARLASSPHFGGIAVVRALGRPALSARRQRL
jgi:cold shock protein